MSAEVEARRAQLMEAAAGMADLIAASVEGQVADAQRRGDVAALQRLQRNVAASTSAATRHIAAELERLGPPPLFVERWTPLYEAAKAASAEQGRAVQRGFHEWAPEPDEFDRQAEEDLRARDDLDDADDDL